MTSLGLSPIGVNRLSRAQRQRGLSLIELMVGLFLALLTGLTALYAYKGLILNATNSKINSKTQGVSAALAVQISRMVLQAGWGIGASQTPVGGAANTDVILLTGASASGTALSGTAVTLSSQAAVGNAVVWDTAISGTTTCSALLVPAQGGLQYLGPVKCTNAAAWSSLTWSPNVALLAADALPSATWTALRASCSPYAVISAGNSAIQLSLSGTARSAVTACLSNIPN